ncbi:hypothetical protein LCGC14_0362760 [marine sediment metagenome]
MKNQRLDSSSSVREFASHGWRLALAGTMLSLPLATPVFANAWVQAPGETLAILKFSHTDDATVFDESSERTRFPDRGESRQDQLNLYIEHGLTSDLTFVGNFYYNKVRYDSDTFSGSNSGFGNQEIGLRYKLNPPSEDQQWVGAVQALISIPTYDEDDTPALGVGGNDFEMRYSVGRGFMLGSRSAYVDAGAAWRLRSGDAADEIRVDITSGVALTPKWMLIGELNVIEGLGNGSDWDRMSFIDSTDYDLTKLSLSALYSMSPEVQFQAGYTEPVLGRNTGAAGGPFIAAWWRF